jgi:hypothetical protein
MGQLMHTTHRFDIDSDNGDEVVMICPNESCRRRVVIKRSGGLVVLDQGEFGALHVGGSPGMHISADVRT